MHKLESLRHVGKGLRADFHDVSDAGDSKDMYFVQNQNGTNFAPLATNDLVEATFLKRPVRAARGKALKTLIEPCFQTNDIACLGLPADLVMIVEHKTGSNAAFSAGLSDVAYPELKASRSP
jgi:hypothetical protein